MSLTLNATLQTAQDGNAHHPILSLISESILPDIPFDGEFLTTNTDNEEDSASLTHSTGRILTVYTSQNGSTVTINYTFTDTARQVFNSVTYDFTTTEILDISIEELANGDVGFIYIEDNLSGSYNLIYKIVTVLGVPVSNATIATWADSQPTSGPFVLVLADTTYLMVYTRKTTTDYQIFKRTSADFTTWSGETDITPSGIPDTTLRIANPTLLQDTTGEIWLWFDYLNSVAAGGGEITNIYYSTSVDNGVTWAAVTAFTAFTDLSKRAEHPIAVQKTANEIHVIYNEVQSSLNMNESEINWIGAGQEITDIHFDAVNRKLYVIAANAGAGAKALDGINKIDVDTWTVDKGWDCGTTPQFNSLFCTEHIWFRSHHGEGQYAVIGTVNETNQIQIAILDGQADTITEYHLMAWAFYSVTQNVSWNNFNTTGTRNPGLVNTWIDEANDHMYCLIRYSNPDTIQVGRFTISAGVPATMTDIIIDAVTWQSSGLAALDEGDFLVYPGSDLIIVSNHIDVAFTFPGRVRLYNISTGAIWKEYNTATNPAFPLHGLTNMEYDPVTGILYGAFDYEVDLGQAGKRGLVEINTNTDIITFRRPTYATLNDYLFHEMRNISSSRLLIGTALGAVIYDKVAQTWEIFDNTTLPGLIPGAGNPHFLPITFDETNEFVYGGVGPTAFDTYTGVIGFSLLGNLKRSMFQIGTFAASWTFGAINPLVQNLDDFDASIALDPDDQSIFAFWTNDRQTELSIKWDKENSQITLDTFLIRSQPITAMRAIDGTPSRLDFVLARGDLFDTNNKSSLLSVALKRGRKLTYQLGEEVATVRYLQAQGVFYVSEISLDYGMPGHPVVNVMAEDLRRIWAQMSIDVSSNFETDPVTILSNLLTTHAGVDAGDLNFPTFDDSDDIFIQWIDTQLLEMLDQVANRFKYYFTIDVDGKMTARKIANDNAVDAVYADNTKLVSFSPDTTLSNYINRIIVNGEERDFIEVIFQEERIEKLTGTVGWWGFDGDFQVWYSPDKSRRARFPRLEVIESAGDCGFELSGSITEEISFIDPNEQYCIVEIDASNLISNVLSLIAGLLGTYSIPGGGWVTNAILHGALQLLQNILSAICNFQYEVWAFPIGEVRRSVQAIANDTDFQNELGQVVERRIDDVLCYTIADCQFIADFELFITQSQRHRIRFTKIAHLRDEEGDTIQIIHPVSGDTMDIFITVLTRSLQTDNGGFWIDSIEGWILNP
jgi:hypothetical protein